MKIERKLLSKKKIVQETSALIKKLLELNLQYSFDWSIQKEYRFQTSLQSKQKFDKYNLIALFDKYILNDNELMQAAEIVKKS